MEIAMSKTSEWTFEWYKNIKVYRVMIVSNKIFKPATYEKYYSDSRFPLRLAFLLAFNL